MSSEIPIVGANTGDNITAPTPQNTPMNNAPISTGALSRPTVPAIEEESEEGISEAVLGLVQGRLAGLIGKSSGYLESLPLPTKKRLQALKGVMSKQTELQNAYKNECLALEKKYLALTQPVYARRSQLINGDGPAPTADEIAKGEEISKKDDEEYTILAEEEAKVEEKKKADEELKGVPEFWLTALRNHLGIADLITDRDAEALKSLKDISLSYLEDKPGFCISFHFASNDYFEDSLLTKTYLYQPEVGYSGDFVYDRAIGSTIKWKEDKDLTKEFEIKKQRNKNTNRTRLVRKSKPTESFFNFFDPPQPPNEEDAEDEDEDLEELEEKLEMDYQIGEDLKEKIIPKAVDYFTGKALEWEMLDEDESDWDEDDNDEEDDDDDDDDDDDIPVRRRGPKSSRALTGTRADTSAVSAEECRQQ